MILTDDPIEAPGTQAGGQGLAARQITARPVGEEALGHRLRVC